MLLRVLFLLFFTERAPSRALSRALPRASRFLRALSRALGGIFRDFPVLGSLASQQTRKVIARQLSRGNFRLARFGILVAWYDARFRDVPLPLETKHFYYLLYSGKIKYCKKGVTLQQLIPTLRREKNCNCNRNIRGFQSKEEHTNSYIALIRSPRNVML